MIIKAFIMECDVEECQERKVVPYKEGPVQDDWIVIPAEDTFQRSSPKICICPKHIKLKTKAAA